jgi:hypothetical protein
VAHCFAYHCAVSPENKWHDGGPVGGIAITGLDKGLMDGVVLSLDDAICSQVVSQNVYVMDTVPLGEPLQCSDIGGTIVHDDFLDSTPPAEDLLKQEGTNGMPIFAL